MQGTRTGESCCDCSPLLPKFHGRSAVAASKGGAFGPCLPNATHRVPICLLPPPPPSKPRRARWARWVPILGQFSVRFQDSTGRTRTPRDESGSAGRTSALQYEQGHTERIRALCDGLEPRWTNRVPGVERIRIPKDE